MPWKTLEEVPKRLRHLGLQRANRWARIFDAVKRRGKPAEQAAAIATSSEALSKAGEQTSLARVEHRPHQLHAPTPSATGKCGSKALLPSKTGTGRRFQCVSRQRQLVHGEQARELLHRVHRGGGQHAMSRAAVERKHVQDLQGEGLIHIHRNPVHHAHEFTVHLTAAGHRHVEAERRARVERNDKAQARLFKAVEGGDLEAVEVELVKAEREALGSVTLPAWAETLRLWLGADRDPRANLEPFVAILHADPERLLLQLVEGDESRVLIGARAAPGGQSGLSLVGFKSVANSGQGVNLPSAPFTADGLLTLLHAALAGWLVPAASAVAEHPAEVWRPVQKAELWREVGADLLPVAVAAGLKPAETLTERLLRKASSALHPGLLQALVILAKASQLGLFGGSAPTGPLHLHQAHAARRQSSAQRYNTGAQSALFREPGKDPHHPQELRQPKRKATCEKQLLPSKKNPKLKRWQCPPEPVEGQKPEHAPPAEPAAAAPSASGPAAPAPAAPASSSTPAAPSGPVSTTFYGGDVARGDFIRHGGKLHVVENVGRSYRYTEGLSFGAPEDEGTARDLKLRRATPSEEAEHERRKAANDAAKRAKEAAKRLVQDRVTDELARVKDWALMPDSLQREVATTDVLAASDDGYSRSKIMAGTLRGHPVVLISSGVGDDTRYQVRAPPDSPLLHAATVKMEEDAIEHVRRYGYDRDAILASPYSDMQGHGWYAVKRVMEQPNLAPQVMEARAHGMARVASRKAIAARLQAATESGMLQPDVAQQLRDHLTEYGDKEELTSTVDAVRRRTDGRNWHEAEATLYAARRGAAMSAPHDLRVHEVLDYYDRKMKSSGGYMAPPAALVERLRHEGVYRGNGADNHDYLEQLKAIAIDRGGDPAAIKRIEEHQSAILEGAAPLKATTARQLAEAPTVRVVDQRRLAAFAETPDMGKLPKKVQAQIHEVVGGARVSVRDMAPTPPQPRSGLGYATLAAPAAEPVPAHPAPASQEIKPWEAPAAMRRMSNGFYGWAPVQGEIDNGSKRLVERAQAMHDHHAQISDATSGGHPVRVHEQAIPGYGTTTTVWAPPSSPLVSDWSKWARPADAGPPVHVAPAHLVAGAPKNSLFLDEESPLPAVGQVIQHAGDFHKVEAIGERVRYSGDARSLGMPSDTGWARRLQTRRVESGEGAIQAATPVAPAAPAPAVAPAPAPVASPSASPLPVPPLALPKAAMPKLNGSDKQVAWAQDIRSKTLAYLKGAIGEAHEAYHAAPHSDAAHARLRRLGMLHRLAGNTPSAKALIDVFGARERIPVPAEVEERYANHPDVDALTQRIDGASLSKGAVRALGIVARLMAFTAAGGSALRKGLPDDLVLAKAAGADDSVVLRFHIGAFTCTVRRGTSGVATMTIEGPIPNPYSMLLNDASEFTARRVAAAALPLLRTGRVPMEGVFRRQGTLSAAA